MMKEVSHFAYNFNVIDIQYSASIRYHHQNNTTVPSDANCLFTSLFITFPFSKENPDFI